jgi:hypothetical protein
MNENVVFCAFVVVVVVVLSVTDTLADTSTSE